MNSLQRTQDFINGLTVDRPPFHPILMRFAAKYAGVKYKDFCLSYKDKCETNILCATDFSYDWVNVMSDAYSEADAYGTKLFYPEDNLPQVTEYVIKEIADIASIVGYRYMGPYANWYCKCAYAVDGFPSNLSPETKAPVAFAYLDCVSICCAFSQNNRPGISRRLVINPCFNGKTFGVT